MGAMASHITSLTTVYSTAYSGSDQRKHQSSASLAFVRGIHRWPVNSPHTGPVTRKMFPFDDVIMNDDQPRSGTYTVCIQDRNLEVLITFKYDDSERRQLSSRGWSLVQAMTFRLYGGKPFAEPISSYRQQFIWRKTFQNVKCIYWIIASRLDHHWSKLWLIVNWPLRKTY